MGRPKGLDWPTIFKRSKQHGWTESEIARAVGVTCAAVVTARARLGLPPNPVDGRVANGRRPDTRLRRAVRLLREREGWSWVKIGELFGVSRQAAQQMGAAASPTEPEAPTPGSEE